MNLITVKDVLILYFHFKLLTYEEFEDKFAYTSNTANEQCFLSLSDIRLLDSEIAIYTPKNFIQHDSQTNIVGVGFFIKDSLTYKVFEDYNLNLNGCEEIKIAVNGSEKVFAVIYRQLDTYILKLRLPC